ncbi:hypothetical protein OMW55_00215 [Sphingomonas sp. BN140010]|uniref:Uncharacterized protein n=1 Tax=Sphingomonas arvum TaxID=2992113 RepID=A0ABT3JBB7_9SPHN|nr:hypothetical protein [Sphingomonas sp. BN140010]MCW3796234.1 hypothetical protein [Sphingomonas sp. BN140010]
MAIEKESLILVSGDVTIDGSAGVQTGGTATATEDNNDDGKATSSDLGLTSDLHQRLFGAGFRWVLPWCAHALRR